jgi:hypothetical protein
VLFLVRRDSTSTAAAWWTDVKRYETAAPSIIRELMRGTSIAADGVEVQQAVAWARAHPAWRDDDPPLVAQDGVISG